MSYDLSHLYKSEIIHISPDFSVTVQEIPHGKQSELQSKLFSGMDLDLTGGGNKKSAKDNIQKQMSAAMKSGQFSPTEFQDQKSLLGIQSWTLKDANGQDVPVCIEAWHALPHHITETIEKAIEALNPDLDAEFQD